MASTDERTVGRDLLTADELSRRLRVATETIHDWTKRGLIPCYRATRSVVRYDLDEVLAALRRSAGGAGRVR